MIITGSVAMQYYLSGPRREPRDLDLIGTYDDVMAHIDSMPGELTFCIPKYDGKKVVACKGGVMVDAEIAWEGTTGEELLQLLKDKGFTDKHCPMFAQYLLKMSHRYLKNSPHFRKTMEDIRFFRSIGMNHSPAIDTEMLEWFARREAETYNYSHPNLDQSKANFFDTKGVTYTYDHDSIHEAIKLKDVPAYSLFLADGAQVKCDKEKFDSLPHDVKIDAVVEESYTLAIERCLVPFGLDKVPPSWAFQKALEKVCTSITSGWFREFAWENHDEALLRFSPDYLDKFKAGLEDGTVKPFE